MGNLNTMIQMKHRDDTLEAKIKQLQVDVELLKKRPVGIARHEFDYLRRDFNEHQAECNVNENRLNSLQKDIEALKKQVNSHTVQIKTHESQICEIYQFLDEKVDKCDLEKKADYI